MGNTRLPPGMIETPGIYDVMAYALGQKINDGVSRPLSSFFSSLGQAQAIYPFVTSLSSELAWAAVQAAVNAAQVNTFGGEVKLPPGRLRFGDGEVRITESYIQIDGEGELTRIDRVGLTGYAFHFEALTSAKRFFVGLSNVYVVSTVAMSGGGLVFFSQCADVTVSRVKLENGWVNLHLQSCQNVQLDNVRGTQGLLYSGSPASVNLYFDTLLTASSPTNGGWVSDCDFRSQDTDDAYVTFAVLITSADGIWFDNVHTGNSVNANMAGNPKSTATQLTGVTCNNCWFDQGGNGRMIFFTGETTAAYGWMQFSDCYLTGGPLNTQGFVFAPTSGTMKHVEISGGKIHNLLNDGISVSRVEGFSISGGIQIRDVGRSGVGNGITLAATCKKFSISGVQAGWNMALSAVAGSPYGLVISAGCVDFTVTGNNFSGNTTSGITDSSGAINKVIANNLIT